MDCISPGQGKCKTDGYIWQQDLCLHLPIKWSPDHQTILFQIPYRSTHEHWGYLLACAHNVSVAEIPSKNMKPYRFPKAHFQQICPLTGRLEVRVSYDLAAAEDHRESRMSAGLERKSAEVGHNISAGHQNHTYEAGNKWNDWNKGELTQRVSHKRSTKWVLVLTELNSRLLAHHFPPVLMTVHLLWAGPSGYL